MAAIFQKHNKDWSFLRVDCMGMQNKWWTNSNIRLQTFTESWRGKTLNGLRPYFKKRKNIEWIAYQGDLSKDFEKPIWASDKNVGTYTKKLNFFILEMFVDTRPSEYEQMIKFMKGLLEVYNNHKTITSWRAYSKD